MKKRTFVFLAALLLAYLFLQITAFADLAPSPVTAAFSLLPVILYAAAVVLVVIAAIAIIRKIGKKRTK